MPRLLAAALTTAALAWIVLLLASPLVPRRFALVYQFASGICHQRPERSFHLAGAPLPVCARCFGLYLSGAIAAGGALLLGRRGASAATRTVRIVFAAAAAPTVLTVAAEWLGLASPSNLARALAGLPLGAAAGWLFVRMLLFEAGPGRADGKPGEQLRYHA